MTENGKVCGGKRRGKRIKTFGGSHNILLLFLFTSVSVQAKSVLNFGRGLCCNRPTGPHVQVMRPDRLDLHPTLALVTGNFAGRACHAAVKRVRWSTRDVHRGTHGHANIARLGPLLRYVNTNITRVLTKNINIMN